ncbi:hypothetical protein BHE74_00018773 [Ensete ventricosum]|nr:hypothetical protein BHE74_00018773 [Ensete ventricosum]RZS23891.1 hypothetical protein BHM03_00056899 [Ensete ventricosum]
MILICIWDETIYVLFLGGTEGLFARRTLEITDDILSTYKNQGKLYCCFILPEYNSVCRQVVGVPVTLNGDLKNQFVETDVGFDTICKVLMHFCELYFNRINKLTMYKDSSLIRNSSVMFVRMPFLRRSCSDNGKIVIFCTCLQINGHCSPILHTLDNTHVLAERQAMMTVKRFYGPGATAIGKPAIHPATVDLEGKAYE